jgi:hypothetical protein
MPPVNKIVENRTSFYDAQVNFFAADFDRQIACGKEK